MSPRWLLPELASIAVALVGLGVALYLLRGLFALYAASVGGLLHFRRTDVD